MSHKVYLLKRSFLNLDSYVQHDGIFQRFEWRQFQPLCFQNALMLYNGLRGQECWGTWWERQARDNLISSLNKRFIQGLMGLCRGPQCQICYEETAVFSECVAMQKSADGSLNWFLLTLHLAIFTLLLAYEARNDVTLKSMHWVFYTYRGTDSFTHWLLYLWFYRITLVKKWIFQCIY